MSDWDTLKSVVADAVNNGIPEGGRGVPGQGALAAIARLEAREKQLLADNAALVEEARSQCFACFGRGWMPVSGERCPYCSVEAMAEHPGTALLEENQRLRADSERLQEVRRLASLMAGGGHLVAKEWGRRILAALEPTP